MISSSTTLCLIKLYFSFKVKVNFTDKLNCHICDEILEGLEKIDDECDVFGIHMVKIQDPQLAKRYSIKTFPAMVYFRNGNPLLFEGAFKQLKLLLINLNFKWQLDASIYSITDPKEFFLYCHSINCAIDNIKTNNNNIIFKYINDYYSKSLG